MFTRFIENVCGSLSTRRSFKSRMLCCVARWRRCAFKRWKSFPIPNSASHAAKFWKAYKSTGQGLFGSSMIRAFRWTTTLRRRRSRSGCGAKELLRLGFSLERPTGGGNVFAVGHTGALENQSTIVVDVVLGELCGGRGKAPENIQRFLPWNLSPERRVALAEQAASPSTADTS